MSVTQSADRQSAAGSSSDVIERVSHIHQLPTGLQGLQTSTVRQLYQAGLSEPVPRRGSRGEKEVSQGVPNMSQS